MRRRHGPWRHAGALDGDRSVKKKAVSYHIIHACDVNPFYASYFALIATVAVVVLITADATG